MIKNVFAKLFRLNNSKTTTESAQFQNSNEMKNKSGINISTISYFQAASSEENGVLPSSSASSNSSSTNDFNNYYKDNFKSQYQQNNQTIQNSGQIIYINPSCIRYSNSLLNDTIIRINENDITEVSKQILASNNVPPKLQIVLHEGVYYSINNSSLQIYKQLEKLGIITADFILAKR